eukprot:6213193-Pleurochrysis_carterae.AAC.2
MIKSREADQARGSHKLPKDSGGHRRSQRRHLSPDRASRQRSCFRLRALDTDVTRTRISRSEYRSDRTAPVAIFSNIA